MLTIIPPAGNPPTDNPSLARQHALNALADPPASGWSVGDLARLGHRLHAGTTILDLLGDGLIDETLDRHGVLRYRVATRVPAGSGR